MASLSSSIPRHLIEHDLELLILFLNLALVEVLDGLSWSAELYQYDRGLLDGNVPVILELEDVLPNRQADELRVALEEFEIARDFDLRKVVAEATN